MTDNYPLQDSGSGREFFPATTGNRVWRVDSRCENALAQIGFSDEAIKQATQALLFLLSNNLVEAFHANNTDAAPSSSSAPPSQTEGEGNFSIIEATARQQLSTWACRFFPSDVVRRIVGCPRGIRGLRELYNATREPVLDLVNDSTPAANELEYARKLMQDPRYWQGDSTLQERVQQTFRRLYRPRG